MIQSFCNELGFGNKGYSLLNLKSNPKIILISGHNSNYKYLIKKLETNLKKKIYHYKIDDKRYSKKYVTILSNKIKIKKPQIMIALGGGSIIDFSKRVFASINKNTKFYIFPSLPGSGAESSITSIINSNEKTDFLISKKFIPNGIIYDDKLINSCKHNTILKGILDALTHCIESTLSINKNYYLNFLSIESVNFFIKNNPIKLLGKKISNFNNINLLSFNGGLAQCNAGSGICHALSHTAEKILSESHSKCISYFILPTIKYLKIKNSRDMKKFNKQTERYIIEIIKLIKRKENFLKFNKLVSNEKTLSLLIENAQNDTCWRLYGQNVDINLLKKILINAKH